MTNHKWSEVDGSKCSKCGKWRTAYKSNRTGNNYYTGWVPSCEGVTEGVTEGNN